ncbi:hypothetical protein scyTo_0015798, partial [Scyliorhinus torazame]|nr:hypothetical protein [Scyliorhinus torazame]
TSSCCGQSGSKNGCCREQTGLSPRLFEPSEFKPLDPTQEPIFPPELLLLRESPQQTLFFKGERVTWIQPTTLKELLTLKGRYPEAKLVVGNTEVGIEMKLKNMLYPVILAPAHIPQLNVSQRTENGITFGAACTLTYIGGELKKAVVELPSYRTEVFKAVLEQLRWFAGQQIRNVAVVMYPVEVAMDNEEVVMDIEEVVTDVEELVKDIEVVVMDLMEVVMESAE